MMEMCAPALRHIALRSHFRTDKCHEGEKMHHQAKQRQAEVTGTEPTPGVGLWREQRSDGEQGLSFYAEQGLSGTRAAAPHAEASLLCAQPCAAGASW